IPVRVTSAVRAVTATTVALVAPLPAVAVPAAMPQLHLPRLSPRLLPPNNPVVIRIHSLVLPPFRHKI
ncbi:MAG: hypothetical protein RLZZ476_2144, partial [Verrucomicrobiota bacterium]